MHNGNDLSDRSGAMNREAVARELLKLAKELQSFDVNQLQFLDVTIDVVEHSDGPRLWFQLDFDAKRYDEEKAKELYKAHDIKKYKKAIEKIVEELLKKYPGLRMKGNRPSIVESSKAPYEWYLQIGVSFEPRPPKANEIEVEVHKLFQKNAKKLYDNR